MSQPFLPLWASAVSCFWVICVQLFWKVPLFYKVPTFYIKRKETLTKKLIQKDGSSVDHCEKKLFLMIVRGKTLILLYVIHHASVLLHEGPLCFSLQNTTQSETLIPRSKTHLPRKAVACDCFHSYSQMLHIHVLLFLVWLLQHLTWTNRTKADYDFGF